MLRSKRCLGEAAGILQEELLEKQATYASVEDLHQPALQVYLPRIRTVLPPDDSF